MATSILYKSVLDELIKNINIGIHMVDEHGNTIFYNQAMADLEGLDVRDVMGKNILEIFPSLTSDTSTLFSVINSKLPIYNKYQSYLNNQGRQISTINSTIPIMISKNIYGALEIAEDITKEKELSERVHYLQNELATKDADTDSLRGFTFRNLIGTSEKFENVINFSKQAAMSSSTVLIYGETGTGKELFAQSIHNESSRKQKPFIAQNCAAIPETLLEGILFGTSKGSFTGAVSRPGLFEQANGGTLLLDEINSMGLQLQAKLLRVLQEGFVRRLGGLNDINVNVRILATTNEEPLLTVEKGILRKDLYYRLNVISINIPPLRERKSDIPLLIDHFLNKYNRILNKDIWYISNDVKEAFMNYDWPGNVRELENIIESSMNMVTKGHIIKSEHLSEDNNNIFFKHKNMQYKLQIIKDKPLIETLEDVEKEIIKDALIESGYNISKCARSLGIKRQSLQYKMKKYGFRIDE